MQISFGGIQIHLRSAAGRLPGKHSVYPNQHKCVSHKVTLRRCTLKEPTAGVGVGGYSTLNPPYPALM